jgi:hypothetical protein
MAQYPCDNLMALFPEPPPTDFLLFDLIWEQLPSANGFSRCFRARSLRE